MSDAVIQFQDCSRWYGSVLGLSDLTWQAKSGAIGLLGPNGAGKSTLMKLVVGLLAPSRGSVRVFGRDPREDLSVRGLIGYCPDHDGLYDDLSALEFVTMMAELSGLGKNARKAAEQALADMGLTAAQHRKMRGFSKGMRQRTKLAQTLVHDPKLIILDEPLTGVDPIARTDIMERITRLAARDKTILVSSHVLPEIESLTQEIAVIHQGQLLAEGNVREIRSLIDRYPHRIRIDCSEPRKLATALAAAPYVTQLAIERDILTVETREPDPCYDKITDIAVQERVLIRQLSSPDNSLSAVFGYLTARGGAPVR
jgi:ABC-2 type transport system ATP-binding protein